MKTPPSALAKRLLDLSDLILRPDPVVKFDELAELTETSRAGLYYYFAGRADLLAFILQAHVTEGAETIRLADPGPDTPAPERLRSTLAAIIAYLAGRPTVCVGLLASIGEGDRLSHVLAANERFIATPIRQIVQTGIDEGTLQDRPAADTTNAILGAMLFAVIGASARGSELDSDHLVDQLLEGV